jgi:glycosyltransferase involved in cell wall biosynthesis
MNKVLKVYHFHNGTGGGVLSVIRNLLFYKQHDMIENHVIYTINKEKTPAFTLPQLFGASSEQIFYYSPKWNFYYTCQQLAKLLPDDKAVIVAHDWLELGMVSNLGLQNPLVQVLHGDFDYYYLLAINHYQAVDLYITVSPVIQKTLLAKLPQASDSIIYWNFPVPYFNKISINCNIISCLFFVVDLKDERKNFLLLPSLDSRLNSMGIKVKWHIAGNGYTKDSFLELWSKNSANNVFYHGPIDHAKIQELFSVCNLMILPSFAEGFPVSIVESMKAGIVPIVNDWNGATDELIIHNETGFKVSNNSIEEYVAIFSKIASNITILDEMSLNATELANELFDPIKNTLNFNQKLTIASKSDKKKIPLKISGSRLDHPLIPNVLVQAIRSIKNIF